MWGLQCIGYDEIFLRDVARSSRVERHAGHKDMQSEAAPSGAPKHGRKRKLANMTEKDGDFKPGGHTKGKRNKRMKMTKEES